ncbi:cathelicidin-related peptide Na_CRAMP [Microcaecilia unicolor]|uniref:Cathelicidin-related peptide Na_CRAMP-like n=1 Tax=Microcaecilia unicolor TaxID=1415580 RepID=A0A6P7X5A9_9AMPH|nr:cathelicidin-related peptide Na_CRAMP-like [Microcaecilia unicolor]
MGSWLKVVLVISVATVVTPVTTTPIFQNIQDAKFIALAISFYNKQANVPSIFKLLEADPIYRLGESVQQMTFRIKETVCQKSETQSMKECDFKVDGLVKTCLAYFSQQEPHLSGFTCHTVNQKQIRVRRSNPKRECFRRGNKVICKTPSPRRTTSPPKIGSGSHIAGIDDVPHLLERSKILPAKEHQK